MNKTYIPAILVLLLLYVLHINGAENHYYITIWWYDVMMHLVGGVGLGFSIYWFFKTLNKENPENKPFKRVIFFTIVVGLVWEGIEYFYDIAGAPLGTKAYYIDTAKDLLNDTIGSLVALALIKLNKK